MNRGSQRKSGRLLAIVVTALGAQMGVPAAETQGNVLVTAKALPVWSEYAQYVLFRVRDWLAADKGIQRLRAAKELPPEIIASVWITADGKVDRIVTRSLDPKAATAIRHAAEGHAIDVPPPDMPQPLRLRFSFKRERGS